MSRRLGQCQLIGKRADDGRVVAGHEKGRFKARAVAFQQVEDDVAVVAIEIGRGFVGQDQRRLLDKRPGNGDALLFPLAQLVRFFLEQRQEAHLIGQTVETGFYFRGKGCITEISAGQDVVVDGEEGEQVEGLEHVADVVTAPARENGRARGRRDCEIIHHHSALSGPNKPGNAVKQRGFSAATRPGETPLTTGFGGKARQGEGCYRTGTIAIRML